MSVGWAELGWHGFSSIKLTEHLTPTGLELNWVTTEGGGWDHPQVTQICTATVSPWPASRELEECCCLILSNESSFHKRGNQTREGQSSERWSGDLGDPTRKALLIVKWNCTGIHDFEFYFSRNYQQRTKIHPHNECWWAFALCCCVITVGRVETSGRKSLHSSGFVLFWWRFTGSRKLNM